MINRFKQLYKNGSFVVFLVKDKEDDTYTYGKEYAYGSYTTTKVKTEGAIKESVFFNLVTSQISQDVSIAPSIAQAEGEQTENMIIPISRIITMDVWLSLNTFPINTFLETILSAGLHNFDYEPLRRKERLEEWKVNKKRLTLYGLAEKNTDMILTSIVEKKTANVDNVSNINLQLKFNEINKKALDGTITITNTKGLRDATEGLNNASITQ